MRWFSVDEALRAKTGQEIVVKGWVRTRRDSKAGLSFVHLNDGSCFGNLQLVVPGELENYESEVQRLTTGCAIEAQGTLVESQGKGQSLEMQVGSLRVVGWVEDPDTYPASAKRHTFEYLRQYAHLRVRTNTFGAVARVRHCLAQAIHRYLHENGYFWIHTPIITASDCEGAGELFRVSTLDLMNLPRKTPDATATGQRPVPPNGQIDFEDDFFGKEAYLTVSGQLNVETYCCALSKVYTFGPTFRAENSNTPRHLAEFWMIEPEIAFADIHDNMDLAEALTKYLFKAVLDEREDDMAFFNERIDKTIIETLTKTVESQWERITYTEATDLLQNALNKGKTFEFPVEWGASLQAEHEKYLTEEVFKKPVIVRDYPRQNKAFYMRVNDDAKTVAAMDCLVPGIGELIGGSVREERLDKLDERINELGLDLEPYWWYRDLRKYGTVPHAGFGLGFERLVLACTGMQNIRDVIPFPRTPKHAAF